MRITALRLHYFRSYDDELFEFSPTITAIIGANGSGKTNILEAIYTVCMGKSFRDNDDELIAYNQDWYKIEGLIDGSKRELRYQPKSLGKQLVTDTIVKKRFTYHQQLPVVLFEPDDLHMLHASPASRRKYIDELLQKINPSYKEMLNRYERVLLQRNNLLKQRQALQSLKDSIFVWDINLAELSAKVIAARLEIIELINRSASEMYSTVAGSKQTVKLTYMYPATQQTESQIISALAHHLDDDIKRGFTGVGPHRHDLEFSLGNRSAKHTASRGEIRTIVLSLKKIELQLIEKTRKITPFLLLDDVFSELDEHRQAALLTFDKTVQTIITTTDKNVILKQAAIHTINR